MQPTYLPWLGYFDLIRKVDVFVIYDHVQFEKRSWQQRNRIRNAAGEIMLTVAVETKSKFNQSIKDVKIDHTQKSLVKHLASIKMAYAKSPNFDRIYPAIENAFRKKVDFLMDLNLELIRTGMQYFNIQKDILFSSQMDIAGQKVEALINVCKKIGANQYLSAAGSKTYIDENNLFPVNEIELSYQSFTSPVYKQVNFSDFISHLSFIDYLFNVDMELIKQFGSLKEVPA